MSASLERALDALRLIADRGEERLAVIASELGVSRATAHRLLATLQTRGFIEHLRDSRTYRIGPAVGELAALADSTSLLTLAAPALLDLRTRTGETVNLAAVRRSVITWADYLPAVHAIRLTTEIGDVVPPHATAIGKAVLAELPEAEWPALLGGEPYARLTSETRLTLEALRADVAAARRAGYAVDNGESEVGGVCLAAAIVDRSGKPVGAISVSAVEVRLPTAERAVVGAAVRAWCDRVSAQLRADR
ncbi:IclR family transcriptional regulator [Streptomyces mayteni]